MQIKITWKEDGKIKPYPLKQVYETPYMDGESNDWVCGFSLNDKNECALRLWHIDNKKNMIEQVHWFSKQDYSWDDYFEWLGTKVLRIEVDGETYFENDDIEIDDNMEEEEWTTSN